MTHNASCASRMKNNLKNMKIQQPTENSLYVTIGNFTYYFDDSIDGENIVARWHLDDEETDTVEDLQLDNQLINRS